MIRNPKASFSKRNSINECKQHIREQRSKIINELFGGKIGAVNASKKDAVEIIKELKKYFDKKSHDVFEFSNNSGSKSFEIVCKFVYRDRYYKNGELTIYEDRIRKENKICVELELDNKNIGEKESGVLLNVKQIIRAIEDVFKSADIDIDDCYSPEAYHQLLKRKEEIERERVRKTLDRDNNKRNSYSDEETPFKQRKNSYKPYDTSNKETNYSHRAYDKSYFNDYSYSRVDRDPYNTSWL